MLPLPLVLVPSLTPLIHLTIPSLLSTLSLPVHVLIISQLLHLSTLTTLPVQTQIHLPLTTPPNHISSPQLTAYNYFPTHLTSRTTCSSPPFSLPPTAPGTRRWHRIHRRVWRGNRTEGPLRKRNRIRTLLGDVGSLLALHTCHSRHAFTVERILFCRWFGRPSDSSNLCHETDFL